MGGRDTKKHVLKERTSVNGGRYMFNIKQMSHDSHYAYDKENALALS